jgi:hypothetical protein
MRRLHGHPERRTDVFPCRVIKCAGLADVLTRDYFHSLAERERQHGEVQMARLRHGTALVPCRWRGVSDPSEAQVSCNLEERAASRLQGGLVKLGDLARTSSPLRHVQSVPGCVRLNLNSA